MCIIFFSWGFHFVAEIISPKKMCLSTNDLGKLKLEPRKKKNNGKNNKKKERKQTADNGLKFFF